MELDRIKEKLRAGGVENADLEARWLCEALSGKALDDAVERRLSGYPLQYLLGEWDFCHETYEVSEACLIPRADTELLVLRAAALLPQGARFLDLCTGSGCVAISLLAMRPDLSGVAVDLFEDTLALAARNAERNGVAERLTLLRSDVLQGPPEAIGQFDALLSNPPYIRSDAIADLQREVGFEPRAALDGGEDGLIFYRAILAQWRAVLGESGQMLFEIGYDQADDLRALATRHGMCCEIERDLGGNDRVARLYYQ